MAAVIVIIVLSGVCLSLLFIVYHYAEVANDLRVELQSATNSLKADANQALVDAEKWKQLADHRQEVIEWCDEREVFLRPLIMAAKAATTGPRAHSDAEWGYAYGMPSKNSIDLIPLARQIEQERDKWATTMREYFSGLEVWEANHPVPELGKKTVVPQIEPIKDQPQLPGKYDFLTGPQFSGEIGP